MFERERERERERKHGIYIYIYRGELKNYYFVLQYCYSTIANLQWYCSSITIFFCNIKLLQVQMRGDFWTSMLHLAILHMAFGNPDVNALIGIYI